MQQYIDTETGKFPLSEQQIRQSHPETLFPAVFRSSRYKPVHLLTVPPYDPKLQQVAATLPYESNGEWVAGWDVTDLPHEVIQANLQQELSRIKEEVIYNTQKRLDKFAQERGYDGILSLCSYATDPAQRLRDEGQAGVNARSTTWSTLYALFAEVEAGTRAMPSDYAEVEPLLPLLSWEQ